MPFFAKQNIDFFVKDHQIHLQSDYLTKKQKIFKKITGSRFGAILGLNKFQSPLKTWATMVGIYKEEMDETLSYVGNMIEPKIRQYVQNYYQTQYSFYDPVKYKYDMFKENKIFGGIPDGEPINDQGQLLYPDYPMLEIKTTSIDRFVYKKVNGSFFLEKDANNLPKIKESNQKYRSWFNNDKITIPHEYVMQLALYLYLRNATKGVFAIAFLKQQDYAFPQDYQINDHEIRLVELNITRKEMQKYIDFAESWYHKHLETGISPVIQSSDYSWLSQEGIKW